MKIFPIKNLRGEIKVPGDKSISHRSIIISSLGDSTVEIENFLRGEDCMSTVECMESFGVEIKIDGEKVFVTGNGLRGLREPQSMAAAQNFLTVFTGDDSLRQRPMDRVIKPLTEMGAFFHRLTGIGNLPVDVTSNGNLHGITYTMPVASAQVKSAIMLAGLYADGVTTIIEPVPSRDHTEKMLAAFGAHIEKTGNEIKIFPADKLTAPAKIIVPNDISSAAYWIVLAAVTKNSAVTLENIGVNETRTGILDVLKNMGASIELVNLRESGGELAADIKRDYSATH